VQHAGVDQFDGCINVSLANGRPLSFIQFPKRFEAEANFIVDDTELI